MIILLTQASTTGSREDITPDKSEARTASGVSISAPKKTKNVAPTWPPNAQRAGLHGVVVLEVVIGTDGRVDTIKTIRGYKSLVKAATEAVQKWEYEPSILNGIRVPVVWTVTVTFKLAGIPRVKDAIESLRDPDEDVRWAAVVWLGALKPATDRQREAVAAAQQDPSELVRAAARTSLGNLAEPQK
jgi:TonB family protein